MIEQAASELRSAGFPLVETQVQLSEHSSRARADILAWGADNNGELIPELIVEIKLRKQSWESSLKSALSQLALYCNVAEVDRAYIYNGSEWFEASENFLEARPTKAPQPRSKTLPIRLSQNAIERLIHIRLWKLLDQQRAVGRIWQSFSEFIGIANETLNLVEQDSPALMALLRRPQAQQFALQTIFQIGAKVARHAEFVPWTLAKSMVHLLDPESGSEIIDPVAQNGSLIMAVAAIQPSCKSQGFFPHEEAAGLATRIANRLGFELSTQVQSIEELVGVDLVKVSAIIAMAPLGQRLASSVKLNCGVRTQQSAHVLLDLIPNWLAPGGRAVVAVAYEVLFGGGPAAVLREYLQSNLHVEAIIGLPRGILPHASIPIALLVFTKTKPRETLVARLDEDWEAQLDELGDFRKAFQAHREGKS